MSHERLTQVGNHNNLPQLRVKTTSLFLPHVKTVHLWPLAPSLNLCFTFTRKVIFHHGKMSCDKAKRWHWKMRTLQTKGEHNLSTKCAKIRQNFSSNTMQSFRACGFKEVALELLLRIECHKSQIKKAF